jgi:hypothetical protein
MASEIAASRLRNLDRKMLKGGPSALALHMITPNLGHHGFRSTQVSSLSALALYRKMT